MHNNQSQDTIYTIFILRETIQEKHHNFLKDRMSTNGNSKTQRQKDDLQQLFSLSPMRYSWVSVCVLNREAHSLFILVSDLTITYQGRLLYESLITLVPLNYGEFPPLIYKEG